MIGALMLAPDEICFPICSTEFTTKVHVMIALLTAVVAILIGWLIVKYTKRTATHLKGMFIKCLSGPI